MRGTSGGACSCCCRRGGHDSRRGGSGDHERQRPLGLRVREVGRGVGLRGEMMPVDMLSAIIPAQRPLPTNALSGKMLVTLSLPPSLPRTMTGLFSLDSFETDEHRRGDGGEPELVPEVHESCCLVLAYSHGVSLVPTV